VYVLKSLSGKESFEAVTALQKATVRRAQAVKVTADEDIESLL
jgi:hypothetical protein